ncbi:GNAT family N-acetyltransferase [Alkalicoccus urumqiensis]|uniref:GNAT family N-acetyltransferase n=1 Tax=Alkalicoccus urumqiensis TaxID=1548213 RepID=A0A2P6MIP0_ALKUR|nr:GNAT family N-acetyltransferase [Alkalicoccus urumqiensis]PRO66149.1 GNAT family N-acetyltransferase [Alkalicoccus urumqiensis]
MNWYCKTYEELTKEELYALLELRVAVFIVEQQCAYPEVDGVDRHSWHLFAETDGAYAAYARLIPAGVVYPEASIGRVLTAQMFRGQGLGRELMRRALEELEKTGETDIKIQAQEYAEKFYAQDGFLPISDPYLDDGILHVDMIRKR